MRKLFLAKATLVVHSLILMASVQAAQKITPKGWRLSGETKFTEGNSVFTSDDSQTVTGSGGSNTSVTFWSKPGNGRKTVGWYVALPSEWDKYNAKGEAMPSLTKVAGEGKTATFGLTTNDKIIDKNDLNLLQELAYVNYQLYLDDKSEGTYLYTAAVTLAQPSKTGYAFDGWYRNQTKFNAGTSYTGAAFGVTSNVDGEQVKLVSHWNACSYAVTLDDAGGTGGSSSVTATYDAELPQVIVPIRAGYDFQGYFTEPEGKGTQCYDQHGNGIGKWNLTADTRLYACWKLKLRYYLTLRHNTGLQGLPDITYMCTNGVPFSLPPQPWNVAGWTFKGWGDLATLTEAQIADQAQIDGSHWELTKDLQQVELFAIWQSGTLQVTFDVNGGQALAESERVKTFKSNFTYAFTAPFPTTTRDGYTFGGWFTAAEGGQEVKANDMVTEMGAVTYYAHWINNRYVLVFDGNGATSGEMAERTVDKDVSFELPENAFARTGYTFQGWGTNGVTTVVYTNRATVVNAAKPGETNVFSAVWKPIEYQVTFAANGGTGEPMAAMTVEYDREFLLPVCDYGSPDPDLLAFGGWVHGGVTNRAGAVVSNLCTTAGDSYGYAASWILDVGDWSRAINCTTLRWGIANESGSIEWQTNAVPCGAWQACADNTALLRWLTTSVTNSGTLYFKCKINATTTSTFTKLRIGFSKNNTTFAFPSGNTIDFMAYEMLTAYGAERSVRIEVDEGQRVYVHMMAIWPDHNDVISVNDVRWVPDGVGPEPEPQPGEPVRISSATMTDGAFVLTVPGLSGVRYGVWTNADLTVDSWGFMKSQEGTGEPFDIELERLPDCQQLFYRAFTVKP